MPEITAGMGCGASEARRLDEGDNVYGRSTDDRSADEPNAR